MKTLKISSILFLLFLFISCNPFEIDDSSIYWNTNSLVRLQLKGNVKKIDLNSGMRVDEFNNDGFITKSVYTDPDFTSTTTYNYDSNNRLLSIDFTSVGGKGAEYSTSFEYQNVNMYILQNKFHFLADALVPNFKARVNEFSRTDYEVEGNILKIIDSNESDGITYRDTTLVEYIGKYPSKVTSGQLTIDNISYATNGMFLGYTQTTQSDTWSSVCEYYFKPDTEYLMLDSMVQTGVDGAFTRIDKDLYEYNSHKDLSMFKNYFNEFQYTYEYDTNGNWTSKTTKVRYDENATFADFSYETRVITYW